MTPVTRHELLALAHHDVVTVATLAANGITEEQRRTLVRREHLFPAHRSVYFVTDRPSRLGAWLAAVLRCGEGALLGCHSAAAHWQVRTAELGPPCVLVPHHRLKRPPKGIRVVRSRTLLAEDYADLDHVPVTSLFRTLDDLARLVSAAELKAALLEGERRYHLDLDALSDYARNGKLKRVLEAYVPGQGRSDSVAEAEFLALCARSTLPSPEGQRRTRGGRVDFLWPSLSLIVEVDGYDAHSGRIAFHEDRRRDRHNFRDGQITLRFTWADLTAFPLDAIADLDAAHDRLGRLTVDM